MTQSAPGEDQREARLLAMDHRSSDAIGAATDAVRRLLVRVGVGVAALSTVPSAAAHEGSTHASVPHWGLLALALVGAGTIGGSVLLGRRAWTDHPERTVGGVLLGLVIAMVGAIGLIEIQVEPVGTTPVGHELYPTLTGFVGVGLATASLVVGYRRWPGRPRYALLGLLLGTWVLYPVLVPGTGYRHPLGYLLVGLVPGVVGYIIWRDLRPALSRDVVGPFARRLSGLVMALFTVFFLFSAGLFSVNPATGAGEPIRGFVATAAFANPLVIWPAVEFYWPAIPMGGAVSVGTALVIGLLAGLIGINTSLLVTIWTRDIELSSSQGVLGALATTGATACCCCGPAVYAVSSAVLGLSASPLYWAFIDPASPVGALFLVAAVILLTGSAIQLASRLESAGVCELPAG